MSAASVDSEDTESEVDPVDEADDEDEPDEAEVSSSFDPRSDRTFLLPSLFAGRPETVWFDYPPYMGIVRQEGRSTMTELTDKRLRPLWFKSDRNINAIANTFKRSGFRRLLKGASFNLYWGHHLNEKAMRQLGPHQWVNHFPGSYGLGRKDNLWKNMSRMLRQHGPAYDFSAKSFLLPRDREFLERDFEEGEVYIVKPPASAEGRGIRLINRMDQLPRNNTVLLVQRYIGEPYLINNKKFDLRIYVAVTSFDPLRIYIYQEGLVRFATTDYVSDHSSRSIRNRYMHLTNYSVNKKSQHFVKNTDAARDDEGSKWSLTALYKYLAQHGVDVATLQARIRDITVKTLIAVEHSVVSKCNACCHKRAACFELFGFDVLLDKDLKPWLIEVNVACSLSSSSPLDKHVKNMLMTDLLHMVGVVPFDRKQQQEDLEKKRKSRLLRGNTTTLKHRNIFELQATQLHDLPPEDVELILTAEDEMRRRGHWDRVLPCKDMVKYMIYFEFPRYRNIVLSKWMQQPVWSLLVPYLNSHALLACNMLPQPQPRTNYRVPSLLHGGNVNLPGTFREPSGVATAEGRRISAPEAQRRAKTPPVRTAHSAAGHRVRSPSPGNSPSRCLSTPGSRVFSLSRASSSSPLASINVQLGSNGALPLPRVATPTQSSRGPPGGFLLLDVPLPGEHHER